jgi:hypothetical protein
MYLWHYHLSLLYIGVGDLLSYSFSPISYLDLAEFVQKKHRVERRKPSVLQTPYFPAKNVYAFQTSLPKMGSILLISFQCLFLVKQGDWRKIRSKPHFSRQSRKLQGESCL